MVPVTRIAVPAQQRRRRPASEPRVVIEDLGAAPEGDGSSLCLTLCWSAPTEGSAR
ncbi:MAG: hypothetical protein U0Q15_02580 [Kineosporiaceae bacterium]